MLLSIIVLNYKKSHLTIECMNSLYKNYKNELEGNVFEIVIVDNGSRDGSVKSLQTEVQNEKFKNVKILENKENSGFSKGANIGAKSAAGELFLFLNNDTIVNDEGIARMAEFMKQNDEISILGGKLSNSDGTEQASVGKFYSIKNVLLLLLGMQRIGLTDRNPKQIQEVDWVKGGLMMVRKSVFEKLNGFDEQIFMYTDDMELCFRARSLGFRTFFYPDVSVVHEDQGSSDRSFAVVNIYKGILYFYKKHKSPAEFAFIKGILLIKALIGIAVGSLTGNKYLTSTFKKAIQF
jgi:GT2 family glycosyltransferase